MCQVILYKNQYMNHKEKYRELQRLMDALIIKIGNISANIAYTMSKLPTSV